MEDKQLHAMTKVVDALTGLDEADLRVVLGFIGMRYGSIKVPGTPAGTPSGATGFTGNGNGTEVGASAYATFPDLYHAANPETEADKALIAGYWQQVCQGKETFDSFTANAALKDMGYTISNVTRAFDSLMAQDPKYVMQVKKSGTSRQARKTFKLTQAGLKRAVEMLNTPTE
jgi:hypothetical protein